MTGKFYPISLRHLLQLILNELDAKDGVFGIPKELFFDPQKHKTLNSELFKHSLHNPVGVAAGPHTQMAQNIIGAWLTGARYIELKTVQTLDELDVPKPCIDMQDEGYNCEWSQELKITESFNEYLNAWIIIHILSHRLGFGKDTGTIFNMSVGYNLSGIMSENVQWFFDRMLNCEPELAEKLEEIRDIYPDVDDIDIPSTISDNITLSTMHGCPANEIEDIARYLLEEKRLHTFVKLNPTLLGSTQLREILNNKLHFKTVVPDIAFGHDLKYDDAIKIIRSLLKVAHDNNLQFGLKLTNTLESANNKETFGSDIEMMYMSGRALHPLSVALADRLQKEYEGELLLSFSAGANAFNITDLLSCGFKTVTVCSDLLKPGGYMRLHQYFEELDKNIRDNGVQTLEDFIIRSSGLKDLKDASLFNLSNYAEKVLLIKDYKRDYIKAPDIKTARQLDHFECISAPCRDTCATNQDIPDYLFHASKGEYDKAFEVILRTNPFPSVTGMVCDHLCQNKCTRVHYDDPLQIREVKRFISEQEEVKLSPLKPNGKSVAIIGAGPSGLSCAYFLALAGFRTEVFEARPKAGGMVQYAIPGFRLTDEAIGRDLKRITDMGVIIHYNTRIDSEMFDSIRNNFSYVFIGAGAQLSSPFKIEGSDCEGVIEPLQFLFSVKKGNPTGIGQNVVIIGGGNTAMDAARTAWRMVGPEGNVTVVYRRTINEMPADQGEVKAVIEEGVKIIELASPEKVLQKGGKVTGLLCSKMELKGVDKTGRPMPVKIEGSEFEIHCDTIIPAIGQVTDIDFASADHLEADTTRYMTKLDNVFIGGDALRGASTAINAIADGRKAAEIIAMKAGVSLSLESSPARNTSKRELMIKRSKRLFAANSNELPPDQRRNFTLVSSTADEATIKAEAARCLYCDEICNICTTVCPNFANYSYKTEPFTFRLRKAVRMDDDSIELADDGVFKIKQGYQVFNIVNFCNECGNCSTFCPTSGAPYKDKPKICLTISAFNHVEEGYYLAKLKDRNNLIFRQNEHITTLSELSDEYIYENDYVVARFRKNDFSLLEARFRTPCIKEAHFRKAAEMSILLQGTKDLVFA